MKVLRQIPFFKCLDEDEMKQLEDITIAKKYKKALHCKTHQCII